jgi:hypothetical protein
MFVRSIWLAFIIVLGFSAGLSAQSVSPRARELAAGLDKTKYKKKENKYLAVELYIDARNEAAVRSDPSGYSGVYQAEGYRIELRVTPAGDATAIGYDSPTGDGRELKFVLSEGRVDGALLTGTRIYENRETRRFEGVFVNRTVVTGKNKDNITSRDTRFGLGFVEGGGAIAGGDPDQTWTNRVFLERRN